MVLETRPTPSATISDWLAPIVREALAIGLDVVVIVTRAFTDVSQITRRRAAEAETARVAERAIYSFGDLPETPEVLAIIEASKAKALANR